MSVIRICILYWYEDGQKAHIQINDTIYIVYIYGYTVNIYTRSIHTHTHTCAMKEHIIHSESQINKLK